MSQEAVLLDLQGSIATVLLNRPEVHNAFDPTLVGGILSVFERVSTDPQVRVIVLRGAGKSFCAGADLRYMQQVASFGQQENQEDARRLARMFQTIHQCPKPVVACVHGAAMAGGMGLVAASDIVVASASARFSFTEARLGLAPAVISPYVLAKMAPGAARELFLTARIFGAEEALRLGLVHRVAAESQLESSLTEVLADLLRCGPEALAACKRLVSTLAPLPSAAGDFTPSLIAELRSSPEGRAGMESFLARRPAPWVAEPPPAREMT